MRASRILLGCMLALAFLSGGATAQVVTEFSAGISAGALPSTITAGPDGNLWFTENADRIGRITPLGVVTEFSAGITAGSRPNGITVGPDGNLWFAEQDGNRIGRITPLGVVTEFSAGISAGAEPFGITAGPDGNLWFAEFGGDRIGRITPDGVVTEFSAGITAGAKPIEITAGPDGNLWFTEAGGDRIGRITPAGVVTEFSAGISPGATPRGITAGPDGNLWFTEQNSNRIGRMITPAFLPPSVVSVVSRRVHGVAGTFDLTLGGVATNPTTEPRQGTSHTIVFTFDKTVTAGNALVTEGTATAGAPTFVGNEMRVPLTGVSNQQYVTVAVSSVQGADGSTGGSGSVRVGFLLGDVNQNRVVTVADLGQVNAQIAQLVSATNFLKDVNASGTLSVADKGIVNTQITKALPAP